MGPVVNPSTAAGPTTTDDVDLDTRTLRRRRWSIFAVVSIALFMASVDLTIVATALPTIQRELHTEVSWAAWTMTVYSLGQVVVMPVAGRISDLLGPKRVFLGAAALFTVASLACGLATDVYLLVALRALQAVGGGAFVPAATGLVAEQFGDQRDRAVGMFTSIFPIGGIVGPVIGGVLVTYLSWRAIFFVNVPLGIVLVAVGAVVIPARGTRGGGGVDVAGIGLLGGLLLAAMLAITRAGSAADPVTDPLVIGPAAASLVGVVLFARHTARSPAPFIPADLFHGRVYVSMNVINFLFGGAALGLSALIPLYAEQRYAMSSLDAGSLLGVRAVCTIAFSSLAVVLLRRTGYRLPMVAGFAVVAIGLFLMAVEAPAGSSYAWLAGAAGATGIGMGLSMPAANNASLQHAPERVAAVSGLRGMFRQAGAIAGIAVSTAAITRSGEHASAQAGIFVVFGIVLLAATPLVAFVPEHRGSW
jgi:EmrB/QacA subfamily drug resistance transporter